MKLSNLRVCDLMNINNVLVLVCLFLSPFLTVEASETGDFTLPGIQVAPINDTQADRKYELYIKLPEEYAKNKDKVYPVIYFTDAMWHIEMLSAATAFLMEDVILVGISWQKNIKESLKKEYGVHVSRYRDYSMKKSTNPDIQAKHQLGQADNHLDFIRNDVISHIEKNYRADFNRRTYFGYSAGGGFGTYILLTKPDTFKNYILGSPALTGNIPYLSKLVSNTASEREGLNANVFISYGTQETELGENAEKLITMLKTRNDESLSLNHIVVEGNHQQAFPMTGVRSVTWLSNIQTEENE